MRSLICSFLMSLLAIAAATDGPVQAATIKFSNAYSGYYNAVGNIDNAFYPDKFLANFVLNTFGGILSLRADYAVSSINGVIRPDGPRDVVIKIYSTIPLAQCSDPSGYYSGLMVGATCYTPFLNYAYTLNHLTPDPKGGCCHLPVVFRERIFAQAGPQFGFIDLGIVGVNVPYIPLEPIPVPAGAWLMSLAFAMLGGLAWVRKRGQLTPADLTGPYTG